MRVFSIDEIDELRLIVGNKYLYGRYSGPLFHNGCAISHQCQERDLTVFVEEQVRTFMAAGITAEDLLQHEKEQREKRKKEFEELVQQRNNQ